MSQDSILSSLLADTGSTTKPQRIEFRKNRNAFVLILQRTQNLSRLVESIPLCMEEHTTMSDSNATGANEMISIDVEVEGESDSLTGHPSSEGVRYYEFCPSPIDRRSCHGARAVTSRQRETGETIK
jgi:hypothetical protein